MRAEAPMGHFPSGRLRPSQLLERLRDLSRPAAKTGGGKGLRRPEEPWQEKPRRPGERPKTRKGLPRDAVSLMCLYPTTISEAVQEDFLCSWPQFYGTFLRFKPPERVSLALFDTRFVAGRR